MNAQSELSTIIIDKLDNLASKLGTKDYYPEVRAYLPRSNDPDLLKRLRKEQRISLGDYSLLPEGSNRWGDWTMIGMSGEARLRECFVKEFQLDEKGEKIGLVVTYGGGTRPFLLSEEIGVLDSEFGESSSELHRLQEMALQNRSKEGPEVLEMLDGLKTQLENTQYPTEGCLDLLTIGLVTALGKADGEAGVKEFKKILGVDKKVLIPKEAREAYQKLGEIGFDGVSNVVPGGIYSHISGNELVVFTVVPDEIHKLGYIPVKFLDVNEREGVFSIEDLTQYQSDDLRIDGLVEPITRLLPSGMIDIVMYESRKQLETYLKLAQVEMDDLVQKAAKHLVSELMNVRQRGY